MKPKLRRNTSGEEATIQHGIAFDPDAPEWTEADFRAVRLAREVLPRSVDSALTSHSRRAHAGRVATP